MLLVTTFAAAFVLGAGPTVADAKRLAKAGAWDELYLGWAAVDPKPYAKKDASVIAQALGQGCAALLPDDAALAFGLGEKSAAFAPTAEGLYCLGLAARRTEQRAAAEGAFRLGQKRFPKDGRFPLELGRLLLDEGDTAGGLAVLKAVPAKAKEAAEARALIAQRAASKAPAAPDDDGPLAIAPPGSSTSRPGVEATPLREPPRGTSPSGLGYESGVDEEGRRFRQNAYFRFVYFNAQRDFGQRADYEGRVQAALEESRVASKRLLGVAREEPVDVVLYSKAEFRLHHGPQAAAAIAGFYSANAIRMNDSAEITPRVQVTLVHEYVHAVVDELLGFNGRALPVWMHEGVSEYIEWRYQGQDGPPLTYAKPLAQLARQGGLPPLSSMSDGPLVATRDPGLAYALAGCAVRWMVKKAGMAEVVALIRDAGRGQPFDQAFERHLGLEFARFDEAVAAELSSF